MKNRRELMKCSLVRKTFTQYSSMVPIDWPKHITKEMDNFSYHRWIADCPGISVSITYSYRGESVHDEFEEFAFKPQIAKKPQEIIKMYKENVVDKQIESFRKNSPESTIEILSYDSVRIVNDTCILLTERSIIDDVESYMLEMRDVRLITTPLIQIALCVITSYDGTKELKRWRRWFVNNICKKN